MANTPSNESHKLKKCIAINTIFKADMCENSVRCTADDTLGGLASGSWDDFDMLFSGPGLPDAAMQDAGMAPEYAQQQQHQPDAQPTQRELLQCAHWPTECFSSGKTSVWCF